MNEQTDCQPSVQAWAEVNFVNVSLVPLSPTVSGSVDPQAGNLGALKSQTNKE